MKNTRIFFLVNDIVCFCKNLHVITLYVVAHNLKMVFLLLFIFEIKLIVHISSKNNNRDCHLIMHEVWLIEVAKRNEKKAVERKMVYFVTFKYIFRIKS